MKFLKRLLSIAVLVCVATIFAPAVWADPTPEPEGVPSETATLSASDDFERRFADEESSIVGRSKEEASESLMGSALRMLIALAAVSLLAYLLLGKALPRLLRLSPGARLGMFAEQSRGLIQVVDRLNLDPRRAVYVIKVGENLFLVGISEQGMTMLGKLDSNEITNVTMPAVEPSILGRFSHVLAKRTQKES